MFPPLAKNLISSSRIGSRDFQQLRLLPLTVIWGRLFSWYLVPDMMVSSPQGALYSQPGRRCTPLFPPDTVKRGSRRERALRKASDWRYVRASARGKCARAQEKASEHTSALTLDHSDYSSSGLSLARLRTLRSQRVAQARARDTTMASLDGCCPLQHHNIPT